MYYGTSHGERLANCLPEQISWGTLVCSKCAVCFQKALKNANRLAKIGHPLPAEEMAALWTSSPNIGLKNVIYLRHGT